LNSAVNAGLNLKDDAGHTDREPKRRVEQAEYQSVLGFYKELRRDKIVLEVKKEGDSHFVEIPSHLRNRLELVVGSRLRGFIHQIRRKDGDEFGCGERIDWEIVGYWHELGIPADFAERFRLREGDFLEIDFESVVNYGEEKSI
jgi:hypothetical protein